MREGRRSGGGLGGPGRYWIGSNGVGVREGFLGLEGAVPSHTLRWEKTAASGMRPEQMGQATRPSAGGSRARGGEV